MNLSQSHRSYLNSRQLRLLTLLLKFRFLTVRQLSLLTGTQQSSIQRSLYLLQELKYISRYFDDSYIIDRRHAEYFLLPASIRLLIKRKITTTAAAHVSYNNHRISSQFIARCLVVVDVYLALKATVPADYKLFAKPEMHGDETLPQPLPDLYLVSAEHDYFLVLLDTNLGFVISGQLKQFIKHYEEEWAEANGPYPTLLFVCTSSGSQRSLLTKASQILLAYDETEITMRLTTRQALLAGDYKTSRRDIWIDPNNPDEPRSLDTNSK